MLRCRCRCSEYCNRQWLILVEEGKFRICLLLFLIFVERSLLRFESCFNVHFQFSNFRGAFQSLATYLTLSKSRQLFSSNCLTQNGHLLSLLDSWQDRTTSKHFSTTVLYSDFVTLAYQRGQVLSKYTMMILANTLSMMSTTTRTRNNTATSFSLILLLVVALLSSICDIVVVVDASYAISIEPDSEECFIYTTPTDIGSTCIIT